MDKIVHVENGMIYEGSTVEVLRQLRDTLGEGCWNELSIESDLLGETVDARTFFEDCRGILENSCYGPNGNETK